MSDLIVVGAGIAGVWLADSAEAAGHSVTLIGDGEPSGSHAALALMRPTYLPKRERPLLRESLLLWGEQYEVLSGASVTRWDTDAVKAQPDWYAVNPDAETHRSVDLIGHAEPVSPTTVTVDDETLMADHVVWCDGRGEGKRTYGSTWVNHDPDALYSGLNGLAIHHIAPYKVLAGARFSTECRLGSSSSSNRESAIDGARTMLNMAIELGWTESAAGWMRVDGQRIQREPYLTFSEDEGWRWSGFHRNGYALVPALSTRVVDEVTLL